MKDGQGFYLKAILIAAISGLATGTSAAEISNPTKTQPYLARNYGIESLKWNGGQYVSLCKEATGRCQSLKMPKGVGVVAGVMEGPFISNVRASWLVFSKFQTYVCAAFVGRTTVVCATAEENGFPSDYAEVKIAITSDNKARMTVVEKSSSIDRSAVKAIEGRFKKNVSQAAYILQGEVDAMTVARSSFSNSLMICDKDPQWPGPPPQDDCELVEEGGAYMWSCPIPGTPEPPPEPPPPPIPEPPEPEPC